MISYEYVHNIVICRSKTSIHLCLYFYLLNTNNTIAVSGQKESNNLLIWQLNERLQLIKSDKT